MSSLEAVCASLAEGEGVLEALQDLNALLETNPSAAFASEVASSLPLSRLFHLIPYGLAGGDRDREAPQLISRTCAVLDKVLAVLPAPEVVTYGKYIELGLQISVENIKKTSLGVLKKHSSDPSVRSVLCAPTMFHLVTQIIGDDSLQCAKMSSDLLLQFLTTPTSLVPGLRESLMIDLQALMRKSDIVRYRVYELCVEAVLKGGREAFDFVSFSGFLNQLVNELSGDDILVKLNCIELLTQLLDSDEGAAFLERNEVLDKLHSLLISVRQDPLGDVIIPGKLGEHITQCIQWKLYSASGYPGAENQQP
jgi:26S proteasome non-ATPase regulatory subunit 5